MPAKIETKATRMNELVVSTSYVGHNSFISITFSYSQVLFCAKVKVLPVVDLDNYTNYTVLH